VYVVENPVVELIKLRMSLVRNPLIVLLMVEPICKPYTAYIVFPFFTLVELDKLVPEIERPVDVCNIELTTGKVPVYSLLYNTLDAPVFVNVYLMLFAEFVNVDVNEEGIFIVIVNALLLATSSPFTNVEDDKVA
jgi:hypothetical protein